MIALGQCKRVKKGTEAKNSGEKWEKKSSYQR
jgi:hypothetical protein